MAKFPSQRKIMYAGAAVSNGNFTETHKICVPKDLSILNRRGYASTTRKGVPLVYRVAATVYPTGLDGSGYTTSVSSDVRTSVKFLGCQNNWVLRNAAVKFHAAREKMFRRAGVKKSHRGAYSHEIRYAYSGASDTFAAPVDGSEEAFVGGTWDLSDMITEDDNSFKLRLVGTGLDESSANAISDLNISLSYLQSRAKVPDDSNLESSTMPAKFSILNDLLDDADIDIGFKDDIVSEAQDAQDNPPYDIMAVNDTNNDVTEEVELGRTVLMPQGSGATLPQTTVLDVPFGIMRVLMAHRDPGDNSGIVDDLALGLEVLDIFEMQG
jgi:hypothetical protein